MSTEPQEQQKPDGRSKEARALKAAQTETPPTSPAPAAPPVSSYEADVKAGFDLAKTGGELPADASYDMKEGYAAGHTPPPPPPAPPRQKPMPGPEIWDTPDDVVAGPPAPEGQIFKAPAPPEPVGSSILECKAQSIIREAHDKADAETAVARAYLDDPGNPRKKAAFISKYAEQGAPPPPPPTAYGDKDVDYLRWEAAWKPDEFTRKYSRSHLPLMQGLCAEIKERNAGK